MICHKDTGESLRYPLNKVSGPAFDRTGANRTFLQNIFAFRQLNHLPRPLAFAEDITVENFIQNKAQWDKSCQKDFSKYHLEREQRKKRCRRGRAIL